MQPRCLVCGAQLSATASTKSFNSSSFQRDSRNPPEASGSDCPRADFYSSARWVSIHPCANPRPNTRCCSPCRKHTNGNCNYHADPNNYADPHTNANMDATAAARICSQKYGLLFFYCGAVWCLRAKYHQGKQLGCQLYHQRRGCAQNSAAYTHPSPQPTSTTAATAESDCQTITITVELAGR